MNFTKKDIKVIFYINELYNKFAKAEDVVIIIPTFIN